MSPLEALAHECRLHIRRDESGDAVIPGRRGQSQLDFDGDELSLMVLDGAPAKASRWQALGGKLWMGDISIDPKTGHRAQDVKITGIPLDNVPLALRLARIKHRRIPSEQQLEALVKARAAARVAHGKTLRTGHARPQDASEGGG